MREIENECLGPDDRGKQNADKGTPAVTPTFHSTSDYHLNRLRTLDYELTVCNTLAQEGSPCRTVLTKDGSYGQLLHAFLNRHIPMDKVRRILEVGGGYGHLMKDFLSPQPGLRAVMLDLSPALLEQQRQALRNFPVDFVQSDFLDVEPRFLEGFDLAIFNENLGDFPMVLDIPRDALGDPGEAGEALAKVLHFFHRYPLARPAHDPFHCNLGAMQAVEKLCSAGIPSIFISEHSCEAAVPEPYAPYIHILSRGNPERISLKGHDEFTVSFSVLEKIALSHGYHCLRGPLADFIEVEFTDRVKFILRTRLYLKEEHEMIRHFLEDLFKYEYLLLTRNR